MTVQTATRAIAHTHTLLTSHTDGTCDFIRLNEEGGEKDVKAIQSDNYQFVRWHEPFDATITGVLENCDRIEKLRGEVRNRSFERFVLRSLPCAGLMRFFLLSREKTVCPMPSLEYDFIIV